MTDKYGSTFCSLIIVGARLMHGPFSKIFEPPPGSTAPADGSVTDRYPDHNRRDIVQEEVGGGDICTVRHRRKRVLNAGRGGNDLAR